MNTQRPEWNDANNALVGYGVSMVTLYYLRRHMNFFRTLLKSSTNDSIMVSVEVIEWFDTIFNSLEEHEYLLYSSISDKDRKRIQNSLGQAGSIYREGIYLKGFFGEKRDH